MLSLLYFFTYEDEKGSGLLRIQKQGPPTQDINVVDSAHKTNLNKNGDKKAQCHILYPVFIENFIIIAALKKLSTRVDRSIYVYMTDLKCFILCVECFILY